MKKERSEIVESYLYRFPNLPNLTLAKYIYNQDNNKTVFKSVEHVRDLIRIRRGSHGKKNLQEISNIKYLTPENKAKKYNLPESRAVKYEPYILTGNKGLIFSDVHIPFQSNEALEIMFEYTHNLNPDFILLLGDIMDCFELSHFTHDPDLCPFPDERDKTKEFLAELKKIYPGAKIIYKKGNHEDRFEKYLQAKAPELWSLEEFRLEVLLDLYNSGIENVESDKYIYISGLFCLHGHEYKNAISSPANPARTYYLRTKDNTIGGHYHQPSEHTEASIDDKIITCWSLGAMCQLHPKYMPLNKWGHSFAVYERLDDNFWNIQNKKIIKNRVV